MKDIIESIKDIGEIVLTIIIASIIPTFVICVILASIMVCIKFSIWLGGLIF